MVCDKALYAAAVQITHVTEATETSVHQFKVAVLGRSSFRVLGPSAKSGLVLDASRSYVC